jgi:hypothetical protein
MAENAQIQNPSRPRRETIVSDPKTRAKEYFYFDPQ